jgi:hypothetical protein
MALPTAVAVERGTLTHDVTAETPAGQPDVRVKVMSAASIVLVRAIRTGLQTFVAALLGGAVAPNVPVVSDALGPGQFGEKVMAALMVAGIAAFISACQNTLEIISRIDESLPAFRA